MPVFDDEISGSGEADFGTTAQVTYALVRIRAVSQLARMSEAGSDHYLRLGWIAFGHNGFDIDATEVHYWRHPIYLNFLDNLWSPEPQVIPGASAIQAIYAERVRWYLSPGTTAHLFIAP
jgi:hypothetical protein